MLIACLNFIIPEFTKPTTIALVALEDWIMAVTPVPKRMPLIGLSVSLYKKTSSFEPATFFKLSPIRVIPNKNKATPPNNLIMSENVINHIKK